MSNELTKTTGHEVIDLLQSFQADVGKGMDFGGDDLLRSELRIVTTANHHAVDETSADFVPNAKAGDFYDATTKTVFGKSVNIALFEKPRFTINELYESDREQGKPYWGTDFSMEEFAKLTQGERIDNHGNKSKIWIHENGLDVAVQMHLFGAILDDKGGVFPIHYVNKNVNPTNRIHMGKEINTALHAANPPFIFAGVLTLMSQAYVSKRNGKDNKSYIPAVGGVQRLFVLDAGGKPTPEGFLQDMEVIRTTLTKLKKEFDQFEATPVNTGFRAVYNVVYDKITPETTETPARNAKSAESIAADLKGV
jgi:hypothetical protein